MKIKKSNQRQEILRMIRKQIRISMLFVHATAQDAQMNLTDIRCLDFLSEKGSATAGELSKITGLTTGSITAVIARLSRAGLIIKKTDPTDHRKTIIEIVREHHKKLSGPKNLFTQRIPRMLNEYSDREIKLISEWTSRLTIEVQDETELLRSKKS